MGLVNKFRRRNLLDRLRYCQAELELKREAVFKLRSREDTITSNMDDIMDRVASEEDMERMSEAISKMASIEEALEETFDPLIEKYENDIHTLEKEVDDLMKKIYSLSK